jgi:hypothetical protein
MIHSKCISLQFMNLTFIGSSNKFLAWSLRRDFTLEKLEFLRRHSSNNSLSLLGVYMPCLSVYKTSRLFSFCEAEACSVTNNDKLGDIWSVKIHLWR